uniref:Retrovirus-related Pol polyprotein from transposon TNT 1-94 n=1 Tax=Cajanus cajan TaxID=3821 RepID=A0A151R0Y0_CAJCA|nr:hypothetical protein KK1_042736 [Cajanus cajan]
MRTYLITQSLQVIVENGSNSPSLPENPTVTQMRSHNDEVTKEGRALVIIQVALYDDVFIKILTFEITKEAWVSNRRSSKGEKERKECRY